MPLGIFQDFPKSLSLEQIAEWLGSPPVAARSPADFTDLYSRFFDRPTGNPSSPKRWLNLRRRPIPTLAGVDPRFGSRPLCSGTVELEISGIDESRFVTAIYEANVNPSRYVRYQDCYASRRGRVPTGLPSLFRNDPGDVGDEFSFDGSDNWIPDRSAMVWQNFVSNWPTRLSEFFNDLETGIKGDMARRGDVSSMDGTRSLFFVPSSEAWQLGRIETYWEFKHQASAEFLALMERAMSTFNALPYIRRSDRDRGRETINGTVLSVGTNPGTRLAFYAKTNQRIRFEVRHNIADLASRSPLPREAQGVAGMVEALAAYTEDAAETLNLFLAHLEGAGGPSFIAWSAPPTDFLFAVASHCEDQHAARTIVGLLMSQGAVTRIDRLNPSLANLARAHVLERARNRQGQQSVTFVPTPKFHHALRELQRIATASGLTIERRRRNPAPVPDLSNGLPP